MDQKTRSIWGHVKSVCLALVLIAAGVVFLRFVNRFYPIEKWLFWRYAAAWLVALSLCLSALSAGYRIVKMLVPGLLPLGERILFSFSVGLVLFGTGWFLLGLVGLYNVWSFILYPIALFLTGAGPLFRFARSYKRHAYKSGRTRRGLSALEYTLLSFGTLALGWLYLAVLTPLNTSFDARWYHMAIAEHYVASGGVTRFPEGWLMGAYPQLLSYFFSWAFLVPG
jgi:hypothetical protein